MGLEKKIKDHTLKVGVVGLGYVGLPLAIEFTNKQFQVIGIDVAREKVELLNQGKNYIKDVKDGELKTAVEQGLFKATTDFAVVAELDAISICVPTPLRKTKDPDVSYIVAALDEIVKYIHDDMLIVLESTTYPGTTRELMLPMLEEGGLKVGKDIFLAFSPERVDPGNAVYQTKNTPKVMGGITPRCTALALLLYQQIIDTIVPVSTAEAAELVKLLENTFRSINIGLVNEMALMCDKLGVNVWEVIEAASTKPFGFMKFLPGPGLGGHCIPIDPYYLSWKMKTLNYRARFIELAGEINSEMPEYMVDLVAEGLNRCQKSINGSRILVLGVAYKRNIDDVRESPALDIMKLLEAKGAQVEFHDSFVPSISWNGKVKQSVDLSNLSGYNAAMVVTDHSHVDYESLVRRLPLFVDARNVTEAFFSQYQNIIRLGDKKG
jgi:UDP-N-acetyl-D-glucosamine dehydrogenase